MANDISIIKAGKITPLIAVYYFILLLIALSWTNTGFVSPNIVLRLLYTLLFILPLFKYSYLAPPIITVFVTIRLYSVAPFGYLPSESIFYLVLIICIYIYFRIHEDINTSYDVGLFALLAIAIISNLINGVGDFGFIYFIVIAILLGKLVNSTQSNILLLEYGYIIITFCLSIYAFVFFKEFAMSASGLSGSERMYWNDPNYLGSILAIGIVVAFYYWIERASGFGINLFLTATFTMGLIVLGLFASRGAFAAAIIPVSYIIYKKSKSRRNIILIFFSVFLLLALILYSGFFTTLIERFNDDTLYTGTSRTIIWEKTFHYFKESNIITLLFGGGTGYSEVLCYKSTAWRIGSTHNNFLQILYDYGILGFIIFSIVIFNWIIRNKNNILGLSLIMVFTIICMTLSPLMYLPFWTLIVLIENQGKTLQ